MAVTLIFRDGQAIKEEIALLGFTQESFAKLINVDSSMLNQYLNDKKRMRPTTAKKIANGLKKQVIDVFVV
ncbi:XRE family transcriptional regulator [Periweissella cryptocerci]|uniref:XRE family transcriptional regulator n=2 Tax=Periweissella cryptocerci TaxID=2506420 RepID=A0A4P6YX09_9LACO|nr:XRE family transcriptional regulator [Periweissella cryptocerci]